MPSKPFKLPHTITSLSEPNAAMKLMENFQALARHLDGKVGSLTPGEVEEGVQHAEEVYQGTQIYRSEGAPSTNPIPTGIEQLHAPNGTMLLTLGWTYEQGEIPADFLMLFKEWSVAENPGVPEPSDPAIALSPVEGATTFTFEGLNPSYKWSFAIAAGRKTETGLELGSIQSIPSWQNVTIGTPDFQGTVDGKPAGEVAGATTNFFSRNDRKATPPASPSFTVDGTAVDHVINDDGSADLSLEWTFSGLGDAADIDGFIVYMRMGTNNTPYLIGTNPSEEQITYLPASARAYIWKGVRADGFYTFGVQAYRDVDQDIDSTGRIESSVVQPSRGEENPYQPSTSVEFKGNITGTIDGVPVTVLLDDLGTALQEIADLHDEIDGSISTWFYEYAPTTENYPASEWTTEELKAEHLGDLFTDLTTGYSYRWVVQGTTYTWLRITDSDVAKALADAAEALNTANSKRRVFLAQPEPPYDVGDLWRIAGSPDFKICVNSKEAEQYYHADDWVFATNAKDYTDQGLAALNTLVQQAQAAADDAQATADGKVTTFWLPSTETPTAEGIGDLWFITDQDNEPRRWNGSKWEDIRDQGIAEALLAAAGAQATADGKIETFYQDNPPVATAEGDLWFDTDDGNKPYRAAVKGADQIAPGEWEDARDRAAANFDKRNDRISTIPAGPSVAADGTAVDHTLNPGTGTADISFEWTYSGTGAAYDIDGFLVHVVARESSAPYTFGTAPHLEEIVMLPKEKTFHILRGVDPTLYYTFGVQAYRVVDPDIHGSGVLKSAIVKPTLGVENPYHPEANTAWPGDVTGTVGGLPVDKVARIVGCGDGSDGALSTTGNLTFPVALDGEPVIKQYTSLIVNNGHTITTSNRCKGLILLVQGDVVVHAGGKIHMDDKAAYVGSGIPGGASANFLLTMPITSLFAYSLIPVGGAGGKGGNGADGQLVVSTPSGGAALRTSPGGKGATGGMNSAFGGSGGGGGGSGQWYEWYSGYIDGCSPGGGGKGGGNGGLGGSEDIYSNPAQSGQPGEFGGGGGVLAIIAGGNITINGIVSASGVTPGENGGDGQVKDSRRGRGGGGGGGSGGGVVVLARYGNYTNNGSVLVNGSDGGAGGGPWQYPGEAGQPGQVGSIIEVKLTS